MDMQTRSKMDLFSANVQSMKGKFISQSILLKRLAALLYAVEGRAIDLEAIQMSFELIKGKTHLFSSFRGNSAMTIATALSLHSDPHKQLTETLAVYEMLKAQNFWASDYLVVAAYQIADNTTNNKYAETIERTKAFYEGMKAQHYFITGQDDYIFAAMLGLSDLEIDSGLRRMERMYGAFKPVFRTGSGVQALTQVLALSGEDKDVEACVFNLSDRFRQRGMRLDRLYTLPSLGILALLPVDVDTLVGDVIEAFEALRAQKGFGPWTLTKQELLLFSLFLIAYGWVDNVRDGIVTSAISTSLTNIIIAQQTAIAVAAASSASAAASSSN